MLLLSATLILRSLVIVVVKVIARSYECRCRSQTLLECAVDFLLGKPLEVALLYSDAGILCGQDSVEWEANFDSSIVLEAFNM